VYHQHATVPAGRGLKQAVKHSTLALAPDQVLPCDPNQ
jgi:hypothetical protein